MPVQMEKRWTSLVELRVAQSGQTVEIYDTTNPIPVVQFYEENGSLCVYINDPNIKVTGDNRHIKEGA